jgi:hypothetical protein
VRSDQARERAGRRIGALVALPVLVLMVSGLTAPIGGSHVFRQAHVAANIDEYVHEGLSWRPSTYNRDVPFAAFDFPLYQLTVAAVCRLVPVDPLLAARVASLLCWIAALVLLDRLLADAGTRRWPRLASLALFACSPLTLFYYQAPMVDGLAVVLSLLSLWGYVATTRGGGGTGAVAALLAGAFLSTLIKSPVYLPVFLAILWHRARSQGVRSLARPDTVALVVTAGLAVLCFKAWWMLVNASREVWTPYERRHYFGTLAERFSAPAWHPVLADLLHLVTNPVLAVLAVGGTLCWLRRGRGSLAPLFTGLLLGCGVTLLVFFDRFPPHNYYQLPFVFPVAFFGAQGLERLRVLARAGRRFRRPWWGVARLAVPLVALVTAAWSWNGFRELNTSSHVVEAIRNRGEWIREHTNPDDYVIYVFEGTTDDWNPAYLYFARRTGYDLPRSEATPARLAEVGAQAPRRFRRVLVFTSQLELRFALASLGAQSVASDRRHDLFRVDPGAWRRPPQPPDTRARLTRGAGAAGG